MWAPDPSLTPNPTGKLDLVSPLAAARSQPSQVAPLLFGLELERLWAMLWTPLDAVDDAVGATRCWRRCRRRDRALDDDVVEGNTRVLLPLSVSSSRGFPVPSSGQVSVHSVVDSNLWMLLQQVVVDVVTTIIRRLEREGDSCTLDGSHQFVAKVIISYLTPKS